MNGLQRPVGVWRILRVSCRCGSNIPLRSEFPLPLPFEAGAGAGGGAVVPCDPHTLTSGWEGWA